MKLPSLLDLPKFSRVLFVVAFSGLIFCGMTWLISSSLIQYSHIPDHVFIKVKCTEKKNTYFKLPSRSKNTLDSDSVQKVHASKSPWESKNGFIENVTYHKYPSFLVWTMLISIAVALAAGAFLIYLFKIADLRKKFEIKRGKMWLSLVYAIILVLFLIGAHFSLKGIFFPDDAIRNYKILLSRPWIIQFVVIATVLFLLPVFSVVFLLGMASDGIRAEKAEIIHIEHAVKRLKALNTTLQGALQFLSLIIVFSVLTSSTLGESIKATMDITGFDLYPKEMSYVYGLYFTVFLCIIYIPVYYQIRNNYNKLKELAIEMDLDENPDHKDIYKSIFGDVKFEGSILDHVKLAITILAPLLTSLLPNGMKLF